MLYDLLSLDRLKANVTQHSALSSRSAVVFNVAFVGDEVEEVDDEAFWAVIQQDRAMG